MVRTQLRSSGEHLLDASPELYTSAYVNSIGELANALKIKNIPLVLLDGTAPPTKAPEFCFPTPWRPSWTLTGCFTSVAEVNQRYAQFDRLARSIANQHTNMFYVPLRDGLCTQDICGQITTHGTPIWHDVSGHITAQSSAELSPLLIQRLQENGFSQKFP